ncbi:hypothetical protein EGW08_005848, partial [Elysia chlorotica]
ESIAFFLPLSFKIFVIQRYLAKQVILIALPNTVQRAVTMGTRNHLVFDKNYFTLPKLRWMLFVAPAIPFLGLTAFNPDLIPASLGPVRTASFYLAKNYPRAVW